MYIVKQRKILKVLTTEEIVFKVLFFQNADNG